MIFCASFEGIAKPRPSTDVPPLLAILLDVIPITCPWMFTSGPPELPGLMAVSVWMAFVEIAWPSSDFRETFRLRLEIIPCVTVLAYSEPKGLPIAIAVSPTLSWLESPNSATVVTFSEEILTTAISEKVSDPTISPGTLVPSAKRISTFEAPLITWVLVTR